MSHDIAKAIRELRTEIATTENKLQLLHIQLDELERNYTALKVLQKEHTVLFQSPLSNIKSKHDLKKDDDDDNCY